MTRKTWLKRFLACTLALAMVFSTTPAAFAGTTGAASGGAAVASQEDGILVNGGQPVEAIANVDGYMNVGDDDDSEWFEYDLRDIVRDYTVTIDGETYESDFAGDIWYEEDWHFPDFSSDQADNHWTLGGTYTATISILGYETEFQVKIVESPVESIVVNDGETREIIEETKGEWDTSDDGEEFYCYYLGDICRNYEVVIDGETYRPDEDSDGIRYNGKWYYPEFGTEESQYTQPWTVGNTYNVNFTIMDTTVTFPVKIVESPVDSITVNNGEVVEIMEKTNGYWTTDEEDNEFFYYYLDETCEPFTMTVGEDVYESNGDGAIYFDELYWPDLNSPVSQNTEHWTAGNTYDVTMRLLGKEVTYQVKVVASPVESIEVNGGETARIYENLNGWWTEGDDGEDEYYKYELDDTFGSYTVVIDGEPYESDEDGFIEYNDKYYYPRLTEVDPQPWTAGNSYTVNFSILGAETTYEVEVVPLEAENFVVNNGEVKEIIEGTHGEWDGEQFIYYGSSTWDSYSITIGGETYESDEEGGIRFNGESHYPEISTNQSEEPWTAGNTYDVTMRILGIETTFQVRIAATPIGSIVVNGGETIEIIENMDGWFTTDEDGNEYFEYYESALYDNYVVTIDGETYESDEEGGIYYNDTWHYPQISTGQYEEPWTAGHTYDVTFRILGKPVTYQVAVIPSPVESIEIGKLKLTEKTGGWWSEYETDDDYGEYYYYDVESICNDYTVTFKDGTVVQSNKNGRIYYNDERYYGDVSTDQGSQNQWGVGTHKFRFSVLGKVIDAEISIVCRAHSWDEGTITTPATCGCEGIKTVACTNGECDETKTVMIPADANAHVWNKNYTVDKEATCTEDGSKSIHCSKCTATKNETKIPKGHKEVELAAKAATCTETGLTAGKKCAVCQEVTVAQTVVKAKGHTPGAAATCKAPQTCTVCNAVLDGIKGHTPGAAATCTTPQTCTVCNVILASPIGHTAGPDATCTTAQNCATCGTVLEQVKGHAVALTTKTKATPDDSGEIVETCICGQVMNTTTIGMVESVKLSKDAYVYSGKANKPAVTAKTSDGKTLAEGTDYTVTYKNNTKVGKATVTVKFKGDYSGKKELTFKINPKTPTIKKPVAAKKAVTVKWGKVAKEATGYEVMVATNKKFTQGKKTATIKKTATVSKKMTKLKAKKTYYVRVRTYKTVKGVKYYSAWSAVKTCKTK